MLTLFFHCHLNCSTECFSTTDAQREERARLGCKTESSHDGSEVQPQVQIDEGLKLGGLFEVKVQLFSTCTSEQNY